MAKRKRLRTKKKSEKNSYFTSDKLNIEFVSSGCQVLDSALGGGIVVGRMINIVGDKSTAKTGLACEILTNFLFKYPTGISKYAETEAAFDEEYQKAMGMPTDRVDFDEENPIVTVEDFYEDFSAFVDRCNKEEIPGAYVIDSFDALSDDEEMKRALDKGTYGMVKQKKMGEIFRKVIRKVETSRVLLIIISQVREAINAMFGEKYRRSGGKSLDFYATHALWLANMGTEQRTINKVKRATGIKIKAKVKKNKIGMPFRECVLYFTFGYGVDDFRSNLEFLKEVNRLDSIDVKVSKIKEYEKSVAQMSDDDFYEERKKVAKATKIVWNEIEKTFLPTRTKLPL